MRRFTGAFKWWAAINVPETDDCVLWEKQQEVDDDDDCVYLSKIFFWICHKYHFHCKMNCDYLRKFSTWKWNTFYDDGNEGSLFIQEKKYIYLLIFLQKVTCFQF